MLAFLVLALALISSVDAAPLADGVTVLHLAHAGPALVAGPQRAERMSVTVRGTTTVVGATIPLGASRLGHGVTAVQLPPDMRAEEPITVRIEPPGAGVPRVVEDDPAVDAGIASARAAGVVLGVLIAVVLLQIAGWTITREPSIPFYVAFVTALGLVELLRDGLLPLPRGIPSLPMLTLLDGIASIGVFGFVAVYLRLWRDDRRLLWFLLAGAAPRFAASVALAMIPSLQPHAEALRAPILLLGLLVSIPIALIRARRFPPAYSLSSALALVLLGVVYRAVRDLTPFTVPFLDRWSFEIATSTDALLFGIALIVRARYVVREQRALEARLREATTAAEQDPLTGALNRRGLFAHAAAVTSGTLYFLELEGFKTLSDRFGHSAGGRVLVEVVQNLRRLAPEDALIARLDHEEFVVVLRARPGRPDVLALRFAEAIKAIRSPERVHGDGFGASVGFVSLEGIAFENALRIASAKAYRAKSAT